MKIDLKCFATLVNPGTCDFRESTAYTLTDGQTVADLVRKAGIADKDIKIAFVNSRVVGLAPAVGGM
jgi:hypothetical protein